MKILVVGLGSMGRRRLRNLRHIGGVELAGFEPDGQRRAQVGREFEIPVFDTFAGGLGWEPQALVVSTPPDHHSEYALVAASAGLPCFTEASVVADGREELLEAVRTTGAVAAPSCTMRFHPAVRLMRERIAQGAVGRPLAFVHHVGQYLPDWHPWEDYRTFYAARRETGAVREMVPYELNWLTYLFGSVVELNCLCAKVSELDADIDDIYCAILRFDSDVHGSLTIDVVSRPAIRRARIVCEEGSLEWDWSGRRVLEWRSADRAWREHADPPAVRGPGGAWVAENMYIEEMRGYLRAIQDGQDCWPLSLEEDEALLRTLHELERASSQQRRSLVAGELS